MPSRPPTRSPRPTRTRPAALPVPEDAVRVYTDGACSGNPGPGGWAWATEDGRQASGSENPSTNQRMEVWAVLDALTTLLVDDTPILVVSDSTYVVNCFRDSWWKGWMDRGWKNSQKQPVANQDLWKPLVDLYVAERDRISFAWVKGHSGNRMNDLVDQLAVAAASARSPRMTVGVTATSVAAPVAPAAPAPVDDPAAAPDTTSPMTLF